MCVECGKLVNCDKNKPKIIVRICPACGTETQLANCPKCYRLLISLEKEVEKDGQSYWNS